MKPVLFASTKPYARAENLRAVFEAYDGPKEFVQVNGCRRHEAIRSGRYDVMVIDEYPSESPGKCVMIWHAIQGGKRMGLDQNHPYYYEWQAPLITFAVASGNTSAGLLASCSHLPIGRVLPLGVPRTDAYVTAQKGDGKTVLAEKRSYLYVPTFRASDEPQAPQVDWDWLDNALTDNELLAVKGHMATDGIGIGNRKHIIEIDPQYPSAPFLYDCDAIVTDYSSILFDGYLLNKPVVLFEKESGYVEKHGMYLKYPEEYSSRYCTDEESLLRMLREADGLTETEREVIHRMADACDGHATERVCELIRQLAADA